MTTPLPSWTPTTHDAAITEFARWCAAHRAAPAAVEQDYRELWEWSVAQPSAFWSAIADYFGIVSGLQRPTVHTSDPMPGTRWFPGVTVNYVERLFRDRATDDIALIDVAEPQAGAAFPVRRFTWSRLRGEVAAFAAALRSFGVRPGDRVVGYLPNIAETVVAFLGTASIGAVWASCGQEYSPQAAANRFGQLEPVVLVTADGYRFGGREHPRHDEAEELRGLLPTVRYSVQISRLGIRPPSWRVITWDQVLSGNHQLAPAVVEFSHPLWVLFSSGTTGQPKGIVHGHGGILLEHSKALALHNGLKPGEVFLWYTTPSWMVWNYLVSGLLTGCTIVCYDGSTTHPGPDVLWGLAARTGATFFGTSPGHLAASAKARLRPGRTHDLGVLRAIGSSGSPLPAAANAWVAEHVRPDVQVMSISGGTDIVSAFAGSAPTLPVWPGELSAPCLGVALDAWDHDGKPVRDRPGELVVTRPMPSMPVHFWNDPGDRRYRDSYFSTYRGVWRHGDWITITDRGSVIVHGRSDATLNRNGVRMGSGDIYQVVESLPEVAEALVIGAEQPDGDYWMPMFVRTSSGVSLDDPLRDRIRSAIRVGLSPLHVPDDIVSVSGIPHTRTGKKLEVPVKRVLQGAEPDSVADHGSVDDPGLLAWFAHYRERRKSLLGAHAPFVGPASVVMPDDSGEPR
ncbi:acetoacetate--CoA ligase [Streptomyces griseorubiginosus]|uniref:acetoacetate--CoA ligase n=1 Tax=Streptomyces griseorubiginosus TaxID=67304 RepID=UPI001AD6EFEC|nr:acetoacetate--CoA ligase [Streptomyces griseorubiginosus]MBO4254089.1 acetoacetate--CoA ligase [Streptomyces griseorubiginosus]